MIVGHFCQPSQSSVPYYSVNVIWPVSSPFSQVPAYPTESCNHFSSAISQRRVKPYFLCATTLWGW